MSNVKKTAAEANGMPDFETWVKEPIGFRPYWKPTEGDFFYAAPMMRDERDPDHVRYLMLAMADIPKGCFTGPKNARVPAPILKGETFNVSVYHALDDAFRFYCEEGTKGDAIPIYCKAMGKTETDNNREVWQWDVRVSPETHTRLQAARRMALGLPEASAAKSGKRQIEA